MIVGGPLLPIVTYVGKEDEDGAGSWNGRELGHDEGVKFVSKKTQNFCMFPRPHFFTVKQKTSSMLMGSPTNLSDL